MAKRDRTVKPSRKHSVIVDFKYFMRRAVMFLVRSGGPDRKMLVNVPESVPPALPGGFLKGHLFGQTCSALI
jgi:hypothetical protein